MIARNLSATD